jgi:hypothetical protein
MCEQEKRRRVTWVDMRKLRSKPMCSPAPAGVDAATTVAPSAAATTACAKTAGAASAAVAAPYPQETATTAAMPAAVASKAAGAQWIRTAAKMEASGVEAVMSLSPSASGEARPAHPSSAMATSPCAAQIWQCSCLRRCHHPCHHCHLVTGILRIKNHVVFVNPIVSITFISKKVKTLKIS